MRHCAMHVVLYGPRGKRWALTERGEAAVRREPGRLAIGPSTLAWDGDALVAAFDEVAVPLPSRLRGRVRVHPGAPVRHQVLLDAAGLHRWSPLAPCARVEIELERPALRWSGQGYLDTNWGDGPLEASFTRWDWSRASLPGGEAAILYDVTRRDGSDLAVALRIDRTGAVEQLAPPAPAPLPRTRWGVERGTRADQGHGAAVIRTLEDTPFYARSVLRQHLLGEDVHAMHESLSLDRFKAPWVQAMLPFRMPRALR